MSWSSVNQCCSYWIQQPSIDVTREAEDCDSAVTGSPPLGPVLSRTTTPVCKSTVTSNDANATLQWPVNQDKPTTSRTLRNSSWPWSIPGASNFLTSFFYHKKTWLMNRRLQRKHTNLFLPGSPFAHFTTLTSCLSPNSLRLVSRFAAESGWPQSCPAFTTSGSMDSRMLRKTSWELKLGPDLGEMLWMTSAGSWTGWSSSGFFCCPIFFSLRAIEQGEGKEKREKHK